MAAGANEPVQIFDTILYVVENYSTGNFETCLSRLNEFNFSKTSALSSLKKFIAELVKIDVNKELKQVALDSAYKKTLFKEIFDNFQKIPIGAKWEFYPEYKDRRTIIEGPAKAKLSSCVEDIISLRSKFTELLASFPVATGINATGTTNNTISQTYLNSVKNSLKRSYSTQFGVRNRAASLCTNPNDTRQPSTKVVKGDESQPIPKPDTKKKPKKTNIGTGAPISDTIPTAAPKIKVAVKATFSTDVTLDSVKTYCTEKSSVMKPYADKFIVEELGAGKTTRSVRITCSAWPECETKLSSDILWPKGFRIEPWRGEIKDLKKRTYISRFVGNLSKDTTIEGLKREIERIYSNDNVMKDVDVHVEAFKGKNGVIRTDVRSFVIKITKNDKTSPPDDLLSVEKDWKNERIFVRPWTGRLPSELINNEKSTERKTFA